MYSDLNNIDKKRLDLLNKKDSIESEFEMKKDIIKLYEYKRNGIADKLIEHYNLKLEPLTQDLETIQRCKDKVDLAIADMEVKNQSEILKLKGIENDKVELEQSLRGMGKSELEIKNSAGVKFLEASLKQGRKEMKSEKEKLARRKSEIDFKIFKINNRISPYKYKQAEFIRVKERKPGIGIIEPSSEDESVTDKTQSESSESNEHTSSHTDEGEKNAKENDENVVGATQSESNEHTKFKAQESPHTDEGEKNAKENDGQLTTLFYISEWNNYLKDLREKSGKEILIGELLDKHTFLRLATLSEKDKLDFTTFKKDIILYYIIRLERYQ